MFLCRAIPAAVGAVALFAHGADTHMIMNMPTPYGFTTAPMVEVSPLDGVTYKYPCQGLYNSGGAVTTVEAGGPPTLVQFTGTAAHGGGSCQFSISYDDPEAAGGWNSSATFKTIYSLIGGCPVSAMGNLAYHGSDAHGRSDGLHCGNDTGKECIRQFPIPFPKFLKNGRATFSWTWHNRMGNREIYQNCAPVLITGGTGDQAQIDALPKIFLGDLPAVQKDIPDHVPCSLAQGQVVNYPKPGKYGRVLEPPTDPKYGAPDNYCSDVPPASVLPTFVEDLGTVDAGSAFAAAPTQGTDSTTYEQNPSLSGSYFITIPTDTTAGTSSTTAGGPTYTSAPAIGTTTGTTAATSSTKKSCGKPGSVLPSPSTASGVDATGTTDSAENTVTLTSIVTVMAHTVTVTHHRGCAPAKSSSTSPTQAVSTPAGYGGGPGGSTAPDTTTSTSTSTTDAGGYGSPGGGGSTAPGTTTSTSTSSTSTDAGGYGGNGSSSTTTSSSSSQSITFSTVSISPDLATTDTTTTTPPTTAKASTTSTPSAAPSAAATSTTPSTDLDTTATDSDTATTTYPPEPSMPPVNSASYDVSWLASCTPINSKDKCYQY